MAFETPPRFVFLSLHIFVESNLFDFFPVYTLHQETDVMGGRDKERIVRTWWRPEKNEMKKKMKKKMKWNDDKKDFAFLWHPLKQNEEDKNFEWNGDDISWERTSLWKLQLWRNPQFEALKKLQSEYYKWHFKFNCWINFT